MISVVTYLIALMTFAPSSQTIQSENPQEVAWKKTNHDFGEIIQGTKAKYVFTFTNNGKTDLIIANATASCGCTVPNFSKEPVAPGATGSVTVIFDSTGKTGKFSKSITVSTNFGTSILGISGNIKVEPDKPKSPVQLGD